MWMKGPVAIGAILGESQLACPRARVRLLRNGWFSIAYHPYSLLSDTVITLTRAVGKAAIAHLAQR